MGIVKEFKQFALRGNVVDLAVGFIVGGAFGKIVSSLVNDIVMPPIGYLIGGVDFSDLSITLKPEVVEAEKTIPAVTLNYGAFINNVLDFLIIAAAIFMMVKVMNALKRKDEAAPAAPAAPPADVQILTEIRDILKSRP